MFDLEKQQVKRAEEFGTKIKELRVDGNGQPLESTFTSAPVLSRSNITLLTEIEAIREVALTLLEIITEKDSIIRKLKLDVELEAGNVNILRSDNLSLRQLNVAMQASAEQEEEYISNKLLKRINNLKREKGELLLRVEQEEEMITKTLQMKLNQLQREKVDMEIALEQEQEFIVNRLQKQLENLRITGGSSMGSSSAYGKKWHPTHSPSGSISEFPLPTPNVSPAMLEMMKAESASLRQRIQDMEKDVEENFTLFQDLYGKAKEEIVRLRQKSGIKTDDLETSFPSFPNLLTRKASQSSISIRSSSEETRESLKSIARRTSNPVREPLSRSGSSRGG
ncbi:hypothetical protein HK096_010785 [Nowakowskiella sp. JEL0078]|nr:hypothetical protein HK096_010785 [Nowakowskiella sp. JEL0078]